MKTWTKCLLCISLSLMCLFTCFGYASLTDTLNVSGTASAIPFEPQGLYVSEVKVISSSGVNDGGNMIVFPTSVQTTVSVSAQNASITYAITVHNKTDMTYWYLGTKHDGVGNNALLNNANGITITTRDSTATNAVFDSYDWVPPQTERTFYATYTYGSAAQGDIRVLVNYDFGLHVGSFSDGFLKVLNSATEYAYLVDAFNTQYTENGSTVIGNLGAHETVFDTLFGSELTVNIDGVDKPATVLIERKNVDGKNTGDSYPGNGTPSGCEYTIYITVDDLTGGGQATVYAVSYTCKDGVWYQIGELYEGKSTIEVYENSNNSNDMAFDVDSWLAVKKTYTVMNGVTYTVGAGENEGQPFDRCTTIEEIMSITGDTEFYNKVNNGSSKLLKPVCQILYSYQHVNGRWEESINEANRNKEGYEQLKVAFDRLKPNCFINNGGFERLENATTFSRAELVSMLEDIQNAYDYYLTVNPNG